ncbi:MAG: hypothetical protein ACREMY_26400 [bacterium]
MPKTSSIAATAYHMENIRCLGSIVLRRAHGTIPGTGGASCVPLPLYHERSLV